MYWLVGDGRSAATYAGHGVHVSVRRHVPWRRPVDEELHLRPTQAYGGHPVSYESHLIPAARIAGLLRREGFAVTARLVQEPAEGTEAKRMAEAKRTFATLLARKPLVRW